MNAIQKTTAAEVASYDASLLEVISRAAADPNVDIDKMERLLAMQERVTERQAEQAFNVAMNLAQSEMPQVIRDGKNDTTRSKYAKLETVSAAMSPVIARHGFSLTFGTDASPLAGHYRVTCRVSHVGGHSRNDYHVDIPIDNEGMKGTKNKTDTHGAVSAISYGRRVLKLMIFDVATKDDDGNAAAYHLISVDQYDALKKKVIEVGADEEAFCRYLGVPDLKDLQAINFNSAVKALAAKARQ